MTSAKSRLTRLEARKVARDNRPKLLTPETADAIRHGLLYAQRDDGAGSVFDTEQRLALMRRVMFGAKPVSPILQ